MDASKAGQIDVVAIMINAGANINVSDKVIATTLPRTFP